MPCGACVPQRRRVPAGGPPEAAPGGSGGHTGTPRRGAGKRVLPKLPAAVLPRRPTLDGLEGPLGSGGEAGREGASGKDNVLLAMLHTASTAALARASPAPGCATKMEQVVRSLGSFVGLPELHCFPPFCSHQPVLLHIRPLPQGYKQHMLAEVSQTVVSVQCWLWLCQKKPKTPVLWLSAVGFD